MALFGSKKKKIEEKVTPKETKKPVPKVLRSPNTKGLLSSRTVRSDVLLRPRITEKGSLLAASRNTYLFEVSENSNAREIGEAVREMYKVIPIRVRTLPIRMKATMLKGIRGTSGGGKKAYVTLKEGDKIEFV